MTVARFFAALAVLAVAAFALMAALPAFVGQQWALLYGEAATALVLAGPLAVVLWSRLRAGGHSGFWALLAVVPIVVAAIGQIAFWQVFFSGHEPSVLLNLLRENLFRLADRWQPIALVLAALLVLVLGWKLMVGRRAR